MAREEFPFAKYEGLYELVEFLTGKRPNNLQKAGDFLRGRRLTVADMGRIGLVGLGTLLLRSAQGCGRSAEFLTKLTWGEPEAPFATRVAQMEEHEVKASAFDLLIKSGYTSEEATEFLEQYGVSPLEK